jgi:hypothetical protein
MGELAILLALASIPLYTYCTTKQYLKITIFFLQLTK